jgi:hypothetical protein
VQEVAESLIRVADWTILKVCCWSVQEKVLLNLLDMECVQTNLLAPPVCRSEEYHTLFVGFLMLLSI